MKIVELGLVEGRHELPVTDYVFKNGDISFPINPNALRDVVSRKLDNLGIQPNTDTTLVVYTTGLTAALTAVIKFAFCNGLYLTVKHFDRDSNGWIDDLIFTPDDYCGFDAGFPAWFAYC